MMMTNKQQTEQLKEALNKYARAYGKSFETVYGEYTVARTMIDFGMLPLLLPENAVVLTREEYNALLYEKMGIPTLKKIATQPKGAIPLS